MAIVIGKAGGGVARVVSTRSDNTISTGASGVIATINAPAEGQYVRLLYLLTGSNINGQPGISVFSDGNEVFDGSKTLSDYGGPSGPAEWGVMPLGELDGNNASYSATGWYSEIIGETIEIRAAIPTTQIVRYIYEIIEV